jgi:hypothetical protein
METNRKTDMAWLSGFFDGEGTVRIASPNKRDLGHLEVSIVNTDKQIMNDIYAMFGGVGYLKSQKQKKKNHRIYYRWVIASVEASKFLKLLQPWVQRKIVKEKVRVALEYQDIKSENNGKFRKGNPASDEYREEMFNYWLYMRHLNARGVDLPKVDCPKANSFRKK